MKRVYLKEVDLEEINLRRVYLKEVDLEEINPERSNRRNYRLICL